MAVKMQPTSVIKARLGIEPNGRIQRYFQKRCKDYMDKNMCNNEMKGWFTEFVNAIGKHIDDMDKNYYKDMQVKIKKRIES